MIIACLECEVGELRRPRPWAEVHLELHAPVERSLAPFGAPVRVRLLFKYRKEVAKVNGRTVGRGVDEELRGHRGDNNNKKLAQAVAVHNSNMNT